MKLKIPIICMIIVQAKTPIYNKFISGDGFKEFAPHKMDMPAAGKYAFTNIKPRLVKYGDAIFIKSDRVSSFIASYRNFRPVMQPFILITHNSAKSMPGEYAHLLDDPKLLAWFAQNPDRNHPKLFGLPLGLSNLTLKPNQENETAISKALNQNIKKEFLLYINLDTSTNPEKRTFITNKFKKNKFVYFSTRKPFYDYLLDLAKSDFVLSPPGFGLDCHRTWEALYMGAIPIVLTSTLDPIFKDLPVLIVDSWEQINEKFLLEKKEEFSKMNFNLEKLYMPYWQNFILSFKKKEL